jgi:hypothetical protein
MEIVEFIDKLGSSDFRSFTICLDAYLNECFSESIEDIGINNNSGNVYILLCNGITIYSSFGQRVAFSVYENNDENEEKEFDNYYLAEDYINSIV